MLPSSQLLIIINGGEGETVIEAENDSRSLFVQTSHHADALKHGHISKGTSQ